MLFIRSRMDDVCVADDLHLLALDWLGEAAICDLGKRAAGLFVWAATACTASSLIRRLRPDTRKPVRLLAQR